MSILNEITESQVADWLLAKYTALRESGEPVDHLEVLCQNDSGAPRLTVTVYNFPKSGGCCSGHRKQTIGDAVDELNAEIKAKLGDPGNLRKQAEALLVAAQEIDGKRVFLKVEEHAPSAAAEATQEGRLLPDGRPNPHDA